MVEKEVNAASPHVQRLLSYEELASLLKSNAKFLIWLFHSDLPSR